VLAVREPDDESLEMIRHDAIAKLSERIDRLALRHLELEQAFRSFASIMGGLVVAGAIIERDKIASLLEAHANLTGQVLAEMTDGEPLPNPHLLGVAKDIRAAVSASPFEVIVGGKDT
jgi:hypothetical protein